MLASNADTFSRLSRAWRAGTSFARPVLVVSNAEQRRLPFGAMPCHQGTKSEPMSVSAVARACYPLQQGEPPRQRAIWPRAVPFGPPTLFRTACRCNVPKHSERANPGQNPLTTLQLNCGDHVAWGRAAEIADPMYRMAASFFRRAHGNRGTQLQS